MFPASFITFLINKLAFSSVPKSRHGWVTEHMEQTWWQPVCVLLEITQVWQSSFSLPLRFPWPSCKHGGGRPSRYALLTHLVCSSYNTSVCLGRLWSEGKPWTCCLLPVRSVWAHAMCTWSTTNCAMFGFLALAGRTMCRKMMQPHLSLLKIDPLTCSVLHPPPCQLLSPFANWNRVDFNEGILQVVCK